METGDPEFKASLSYRVRLYLKMGERAIMKQPWEVVLCSKKAQLFSKGSRGHKKKKKKLLGAGVGGYTEEYSYLYGDAWSHKAPQVQLYHFSTTKINTITYRAQCSCFSDHLGMLLKSYLLHDQQILHRDGDQHFSQAPRRRCCYRNAEDRPISHREENPFPFIKCALLYSGSPP